MSTIGNNIKKRREELGLTQEELAIKLGYKSKSTINKIEMGINDISQSKIVSFANVLDIPPSFLMGWKDNSDVVTRKPSEYQAEYEDLASLLTHNTNYMMCCISNIIKSKRIKCDMTENAVAEKSGLKLKDYLMLEVDNINIGLQSIMEVLGVLGIDFYYFIGLLSGLQFAIKSIDDLEIPSENKTMLKDAIVKRYMD